MEDLKIMTHVFVSVLLIGTLWRLTSFHLMAAPNDNLQHLGKAMTIQY